MEPSEPNHAFQQETSFKRKVARNSPPDSSTAFSPRDTEISAPTKKIKFQEYPYWYNRIIESTNKFLSALRDSEELKQSFQDLTQTKIARTVHLPLPPVTGTYSLTNHQKDGTIACAGKSFALYHLYCSLSTDDKNCVMYIPDCAQLNDEPFSTLIPSLVSAFAQDGQFLSSILLSLVDPYTCHPISWKLLLWRVVSHYSSKRLDFYVIFDQYDGLKNEYRTKAPSNLTKWAAHLPGAKIIISSSITNENKYEDVLIKMEDNQSPYWFSGGYSHTELMAWRKCHSFFEEEDLLDVTHITGNIPFELDMLNRLKLRMLTPQTPTLTLAELLEEYIHQRTRELSWSHDEYLLKLPESEKKFERRCMLAAISGLALPLSPAPVFDSQLFFLQFSVIMPIVPLALDVVRPLIFELDPDDFIGDCVVHPSMSTDFKERAVEHYITQKIAVLGAIKLSLKQFQITSSGYLANRKTLKCCNIEIRDLKIVEFCKFSEELTPPSIPNQNTLFLPLSNDYPDIDFMIWDHGNKELWVFQATLMQNPFEHSNKWTPGFLLYDAWKNFLTVDGNVPKIAKVWIIRSAPTTVKVPQSFEGQWMFDFEGPNVDLSDFPLLKRLP